MASLQADLRLPQTKTEELQFNVALIEKLLKRIVRSNVRLNELTSESYIVPATKLKHDLKLDANILPTDAALLEQRWLNNIKEYQNAQRLVTIDIVQESISRSNAIVTETINTMVQTILPWYLNLWNRTAEAVTAPEQLTAMSQQQFAHLFVQHVQPSYIDIDNQYNMINNIHIIASNVADPCSLLTDPSDDTHANPNTFVLSQLHVMLRTILSKISIDIHYWSTQLQSVHMKTLWNDVMTKTKYDQRKLNEGIQTIASTNNTTDTNITYDTVKTIIEQQVQQQVQQHIVQLNSQVSNVTNRHHHQSTSTTTPKKSTTPKKYTTPKKKSTKKPQQPHHNLPTDADDATVVAKDAATPVARRQLRKRKTQRSAKGKK
jgi:hypothetical protein